MSDTPKPSRIAPPNLRPARLDPLQVEVFAAIIATIPPSPSSAQRIAEKGHANDE